MLICSILGLNDEEMLMFRKAVSHLMSERATFVLTWRGRPLSHCTRVDPIAPISSRRETGH